MVTPPLDAISPGITNHRALEGKLPAWGWYLS